jgi:hypothetical protein
MDDEPWRERSWRGEGARSGRPSAGRITLVPSRRERDERERWAAAKKAEDGIKEGAVN